MASDSEMEADYSSVTPGVTTPWSYANTIAAARSRTPSFPKMLPDVRLDRRFGDEQGHSDFGVSRTARHQAQNIVLAFSQQVEPCGVACSRGDNASIALEQTRRDRRIEPGRAAGDGPDCGNQILRARVLEDEAGGTSLDRAPQDLVLAERREHENVERVVAATQLRGRGDAVESRHPDVHEDDARVEGREFLQRLPAIGALGHDLEPVRWRENSRQPRTNERLVVDDRDSDQRRHSPFTGSSQRTRQPLGVAPAANSPPSAVARSCIPISP